MRMLLDTINLIFLMYSFPAIFGNTIANMIMLKVHYFFRNLINYLRFAKNYPEVLNDGWLLLKYILIALIVCWLIYELVKWICNELTNDASDLPEDKSLNTNSPPIMDEMYANNLIWIHKGEESRKINVMELQGYLDKGYKKGKAKKPKKKPKKEEFHHRDEQDTPKLTHSQQSSLLPKGSKLNGRYIIERHLSSGGFGNTYAAINEFGERVAVKEFFVKGWNHRDKGSAIVSISNREYSDQFRQQREKFKTEAMRLRSLHSPHIVKVISFFEENGTSYYVMEYIDGESLAQYIKRRKGKPMPDSKVRDILGQVLEALAVVHNAGLYHLDIKPDNIMVDSKKCTHLIDFGASKQMDAATGGATAFTQAAYTPSYAPLEQVEGRMDKIGPWTDFYALGATLYCLLTSQKPPLYSDIQDETEAAFHWPATVTQPMRDLIQWMMTPNRTLRPQSVADIRHRLASNSILEEETNQSPQKSKTNIISKDDTVIKSA